MKRFFLAFVLVLGFAVPAYSAQDEGVLWEKVAENNYINPDGVVGTEDMYGFSFLLKSFNKGQYEPIYGKSIWYTLSQYTINCSQYTYKIGVIDSYGHENNFINGDYNRYAAFQPIVSGTAVSAVAKQLCKVK